jgi:hypothetical protein
MKDITYNVHSSFRFDNEEEKLEFIVDRWRRSADVLFRCPYCKESYEKELEALSCCYDDCKEQFDEIKKGEKYE